MKSRDSFKHMFPYILYDFIIIIIIIIKFTS